jgi:hypothetical protein
MWARLALLAELAVLFGIGFWFVWLFLNAFLEAHHV